MGDLTANFSLSEFACRDGSPVPRSHFYRVQLVALNLEVLRAELGGRPMKILSGYRSPSYNRKVGGAKKSQHKQSRAADVKVKGVSTKKLHVTVLRLIREKRMGQGGVGFYPRSKFVHYDTRGKARRWSQRP